MVCKSKKDDEDGQDNMSAILIKLNRRRNTILINKGEKTMEPIQRSKSSKRISEKTIGKDSEKGK